MSRSVHYGLTVCFQLSYSLVPTAPDNTKAAIFKPAFISVAFEATLSIPVRAAGTKRYAMNPLNLLRLFH